MSAVEILYDRLGHSPFDTAIFWDDQEISYGSFLERVRNWNDQLDRDGIGANDVCAFSGDFSPGTCSLMFALMRRKSILMPLTGEVNVEKEEYAKIAGANILYSFNADDQYTLLRFSRNEKPELVKKFASKGHPGLIIFTSGSTGKPKAILQDVEYVSKKFLQKRKGWKTPLFLLMDHFGGFNTFLSSFAYGGTAICLKSRTPEVVAKTIEKSKANILPTTPTFLNFLIMSQQHVVYDLSSIELITYGTEPMPETTLQTIAKVFPNVRLKQTFGLSELGVLPSASKKDDSVWIRLGGKGFETKVIDNILWIKSEANMVGYINAPNPFDDEGWMCTGDIVEERGGYIRFKGRESEIINTGGKKVFPLEVENIISQSENIRNVSVEPKKHPIMGQVIQARVSLIFPEDSVLLSERLRSFCNNKLARYKVPVRFIIVDDKELRSERFKKIRKKVS